MKRSFIAVLVLGFVFAPNAMGRPYVTLRECTALVTVLNMDVEELKASRNDPQKHQTVFDHLCATLQQMKDQCGPVHDEKCQAIKQQQQPEPQAAGQR